MFIYLSEDSNPFSILNVKKVDIQKISVKIYLLIINN